MPSFDYRRQVWLDDAGQPMPCSHPASMAQPCCPAFTLTGRRVCPDCGQDRDTCPACEGSTRDLCADCGHDADAHDRRAESGCAPCRTDDRPGPCATADPDPDLEGLAVELEAEYTAALERRRQLEGDGWARALRGGRRPRRGSHPDPADLRSAAALSGIAPRPGDPDARARVRELVAVGSFFAAAAAGRDDPDPDAHQRHLDRQHEWSGALWPIELAAG